MVITEVLKTLTEKLIEACSNKLEVEVVIKEDTLYRKNDLLKISNPSTTKLLGMLALDILISSDSDGTEEQRMNRFISEINTELLGKKYWIGPLFNLNSVGGQHFDWSTYTIFSNREDGMTYQVITLADLAIHRLLGIPMTLKVDSDRLFDFSAPGFVIKTVIDNATNHFSSRFNNEKGE